jgi:hypothetical protein
MFLLYHSEGCNTSETVFHWCYVNDLHTTHAVVCWVTAFSCQREYLFWFMKFEGDFIHPHLQCFSNDLDVLQFVMRSLELDSILAIFDIAWCGPTIRHCQETQEEETHEEHARWPIDHFTWHCAKNLRLLLPSTCGISLSH